MINTNYIAVIPARYESSRFPGKPLADIHGKPMFWHVYKRAEECHLLTKIVLATDNLEIYDTAEKFNIPVVMTGKNHPSGTDRVFEAAQKLNADDDSVIVNIQGDEPALNPEMITQLLSPFNTRREVNVSTLIRKISPEEAENPDIVKVVTDTANRAIYFSRSRIPYNRDKGACDYFGHIGLYAFRMKTLKTFVALKQGYLENIEKLEQLRLLENNIDIFTTITTHESIGVDRPEDLERVKLILT
jgi:3-deoxy-manno-octulosonate cytidylyltransferase (CMP-KDO synthetase)